MQVFSRAADTYLLLGAILVAGVAVGIFVVGGEVIRSDWTSGANFVVEQTVPFSHLHHVDTLGIDCRYCHQTVETAATAGYPPTETCMTCHSQIWTDAPVLAPVRQSPLRDRPLIWNRVYKLPDYVYFNHSAHIHAGIGCSSCHGRIDRMALTRLAQPLQMQWCLSCHRNPAPALRAADEVFDMAWQPATGQAELARRRMTERHIDPSRMDDCYVCHR